MMIAQQCDLQLGEFVWTGGDVHFLGSRSFDGSVDKEKAVKIVLSAETMMNGQTPLKKKFSIFVSIPADILRVNSINFLLNVSPFVRINSLKRYPFPFVKSKISS